MDNLVVTAPISDAKLAELKAAFKNVSYLPDCDVDETTAKQADIWFTRWQGLPTSITALDQIPNTKAIQLSSAGANDCLAHAVFQTTEAKEKIKICSASGIHVLCIPQYVLCNVLTLYMKLNLEIHLTKTSQSWLSGGEITTKAEEAGWTFGGHRPLYGKTVGLLGYGHIARETARLFKAFNCRVIAATSNGQKRAASGYEIEGLGDADGSLPDAYFATTDPAQLLDFASQCDILIAILPSTPQTQFLLTAEHFNAMPKDSLFVSVGRGDIAKSDDILAAVNKKDGLLGAVLDVTDPEPLPTGHALFSHPRIIVTPHTSGSVENYFDQGADVLLAQKKSVEEGKGFINVVDVLKGY